MAVGELRDSGGGGEGDGGGDGTGEGDEGDGVTTTVTSVASSVTAIVVDDGQLLGGRTRGQRHLRVVEQSPVLSPVQKTFFSFAMLPVVGLK